MDARDVARMDRCPAASWWHVSALRSVVAVAFASCLFAVVIVGGDRWADRRVYSLIDSARRRRP